MPFPEILILANTSWTDAILPWLLVSGVVALAFVIGYSNFQNARPFRIESSSSLPPEEVLDSLQSTFARDGWQLGYRDSGTLTMSIDRKANLGSTAALGCLSVWFALLHALSSRKRITVEVDVTHTAGGSLIVTNGSRSGQYLIYVTEKLRELPK